MKQRYVGKGLAAPVACGLLLMSSAHLHLLHFQKIIKEAEQLLDSLDGVSPAHGRFYEMSSNYHKLMGNHAEYYRDALRFLGCTDLADIPGGDRLDLFLPLARFKIYLSFGAEEITGWLNA